MKRYWLFGVVLFSLSIICQAQGNQGSLSIWGSFGYGFRQGGYLLDSSGTQQGIQPNLITVDNEDFYLNFGQGIKLSFGADYMVMQNIAARAEIGLNFGVPAIDAEYTIQRSTTETSYDYFSWNIKAMILPRFEFLELLDVYTGVGIGIYFASFSYEKTSSIGAINGDYDVSTSLGFSGLLGADYPISDFISITTELFFDQVSFKLQELDVDNPIERPISFEKNAEDRPAPPSIPGTNWGLKVGLRFWLL